MVRIPRYGWEGASGRRWVGTERRRLPEVVVKGRQTLLAEKILHQAGMKYTFGR